MQHTEGKNAGLPRRQRPSADSPPAEAQPATPPGGLGSWLRGLVGGRGAAVWVMERDGRLGGWGEGSLDHERPET